MRIKRVKELFDAAVQILGWTIRHLLGLLAVFQAMTMLASKLNASATACMSSWRFA